MDVFIRKAELSDFDEILRLNQALFNFEEQFQHQYNLNWTYSEAGRNFFKDRFNNKNALIFVAIAENKIVGYILALINFYSYRRVNPICDIENLIIEEDYRKNGVGSKLMENVRKAAKEKAAKKLRVNAIAQNKNALSFYRSHGFEDAVLFLEEEIE